MRDNFLDSYTEYIKVPIIGKKPSVFKVVLVFLLFLIISGALTSFYLSVYTAMTCENLVSDSMIYLSGKMSYEEFNSIINNAINDIPLYIRLIGNVLLIITVAVGVTKSEKRSFVTLGVNDKKGVIKYGIGIIAGIIIVGLVISLLLLSDNIVIEKGNYTFNGLFVLIIIGWIIQSFAEEYLYRGYLLQSSANATSVTIGVIISSFFFALLHTGNAGINFLSFINIYLIGSIFALLTLYTKSIYFAAGFHFSWNILLGNVLGINVSGNVIKEKLFSSVFIGNEVFTGGAFGIEGSIYTLLIAVILLGIIILLMLKKHIKNKQQEKGVNSYE